ncbi:MAG: family 10 glycosylhydrolase [Candidatus Helarchaeota archaeon]
MNVGVYVFPQLFINEEIEGLIKFLAQNSITHLHIAFNENYVLTNDSVSDLLFFNPDKIFFQNNNHLLNFSSNYEKIIKQIIPIAKKQNIKIIAWVNCLKHPEIIKKYPEWSQINLKGGKTHQFLCPNNPDVKNYIAKLITNIIKKYPVDGIELFNARFPSPYKEDFCCFCDSCKIEAANPHALEDLKEREIINDNAKGINLELIKKYFLKKSDLIYSRTLSQDLIFQTWNQFRYNSITRFVGKILIEARQANQNVTVGTDVWPISTAELLGQNYADLVTYQDLIYQNLFIDTVSDFMKFNKITKEINELKKLIKKGRGLKKFHSSININLPVNTNEFKKILFNLREMKLKGLVLFYISKVNKNKLKLISELLKKT